MGSNQRVSPYQMVKMNKTGPKVTVSAQKGAEVTNTTPQRGHGSIAVSTQRSAAVSSTPSVHQKSEARHPIIPSSSSRYPRSVSLQAGPGFSGAPTRGGTESRSKSEAYQHSTLQQKIQQTQTPLPHAVQTQQKISLSREEATRKGGESKSGRDSKHYSLIPDAKSFRQLVFLDQKNNKQILQEEDPPSKVQYPQGVRVSRKSLVSPKDEAVQTEPIRKSVTAAEVRFSRRTSSPEHGNRLIFADSRTAQRRIPGQESETGLRNSTHTEPKALHRSKNLESSLTLSILKDVGSGRQFSVRTEHEPIHKHSAYTEPSPPARVLTSSEVESNIKSPVRGDSETSRRVIICSEAQPAQTAHHVTSRAGTESPRKSFMFTFPEPVYKQHTWRPSESVRTSPGYILKHPDPSPNSVRAKVELTPRPLPPRPLPKYGPESSWWTLLNTEVEMPQSQLTTSDFEAKSLPPIDYSLSSFEIDSSPFCEDMMFLREKTSTSPPPAPATPPPLQSPKESPSRPLLRGVPQAPKCTSKQPTQRFSAFFLGM